MWHSTRFRFGVYTICDIINDLPLNYNITIEQTKIIVFEKSSTACTIDQIKININVSNSSNNCKMLGIVIDILLISDY